MGLIENETSEEKEGASHRQSWAKGVRGRIPAISRNGMEARESGVELVTRILKQEAREANVQIPQANEWNGGKCTDVYKGGKLSEFYI